jgi:hypothetical protein
MTYRDRLNRWLVIRLLPKMQRVTLVRCYRESDADGYVRVLRRLMPDEEFIVVFDPGESQNG